MGSEKRKWTRGVVVSVHKGWGWQHRDSTLVERVEAVQNIEERGWRRNVYWEGARVI